ncbi:MAG: hypothetical protein AAFR59_14940, partial [Bacteroidota bacterium]
NIIHGNQAVNSDDGMYELKRIKLLNRHTNSQISGWAFDYFYRDNSQSNFSSQGKRLMLASMGQIGNHGLIEVPYVFTYDPTPLPDPNSSAVDHWGYYNRKNNKYLVPSYTHVEDEDDSGNIDFLYYKGADRSPDLTGSKASVLQKITLPTGGFSEFEYELHEYGYIGITEVSNIYPYRVMQKETSCYSISSGYTNQWQVSSVPFEVVSTIPSVSASSVVDIPTRLVAYGQTFIDFAGQQAKVAIHRDFGNGSYASTPTRKWELAYTGEFEEFSEDFLLPPGNYVLVCSTKHAGDNITADIFWENLEEGSPTLSKKAGGLRIKKIITHSEENDPLPLTRKFQYEAEHPLGMPFSSGVLQGEAEYAIKSHVVSSRTITTEFIIGNTTNTVNQTFCYDCRSLNLVGASRIILGNRENSHVNYRQVTTLLCENGEGGSTKFYLSNALDTGEPNGRSRLIVSK